MGVAVQNEARRLGRIRLQRQPNASGPSLLQFVQDAIAPGSHVHTDGWVEGAFYRVERRRTVIEGSGSGANTLF